MNRIDVFADKKLNRKSEGGKLNLTFTNVLTMNLLLDWAKLSEAIEEVNINFEGGIAADILEIGVHTASISYQIGANSHINIARAKFETLSSKNTRINIAENGEVTMGIADFATGKMLGDVAFYLRGRGARATFRLAAVGRQNSQKKYTVSFYHHVGDTYSSMENYGVVQEDSQLLFDGVSHIIKGSAGAEAHQKAKIMVFDPNCIAKANPILKIDENRVAASHAATVGKVNDEHLFYLTSRGIPFNIAKQLITYGYLNPIVSAFTDPEMKEKVEEFIQLRANV